MIAPVPPCALLPFRAEGEYNYVPCRLSAAGRAGGWNSQAVGGGIQPGLPVNEQKKLCISSHIYDETQNFIYQLWLLMSHYIVSIWISLYHVKCTVLVLPPIEGALIHADDVPPNTKDLKN